MTPIIIAWVVGIFISGCVFFTALKDGQDKILDEIYTTQTQVAK